MRGVSFCRMSVESSSGWLDVDEWFWRDFEGKEGSWRRVYGTWYVDSCKIFGELNIIRELVDLYTWIWEKGTKKFSKIFRSIEQFAGKNTNAFIFIFYFFTIVIYTSKRIFRFKDPSTKLLKSINFYILYFNDIATNIYIDKGFCFFYFLLKKKKMCATIEEQLY